LPPEPFGSLDGVRTASTSGHGTQAAASIPRPPPTAWTSRRAVKVHVVAAVVVPGCLVLAWWQATRALSGNTLSWAYTFEWPVFAGYAVYMWWKLVHDQPADDPVAARADPAVGGPPAGAPEPDGTPGTPGAPGTPGTPGTAGTAGTAGTGTAGTTGTHATDDGAEGGDDELAAYNDYLAALHASGRRKHWVAGRRAGGNR